MDSGCLQQGDLQRSYYYVNSTLSLGIVSFLACTHIYRPTSSKSNDNDEVQLYGAKVAATISELPVCDSLQVGQRFNVVADEEFHFCTKGGYQLIDLRGVTERMVPMVSMELTVKMVQKKRDVMRPYMEVLTPAD